MMNKENSPFGQQMTPSTTDILKNVESRDYEYFADLNRQSNDIADVPEKGKEALKELYRFSYRYGEELRKEQEAGKTANTNGADANAGGDNGVKGELYVRSKWLHRWRKRFGSVANHAQYGPVLFLFAYNKEGTVDLKNSQMIALTDSVVRLSRNAMSGDGKFKCEFILTTQKKKHVLAADDAITRDYWIESVRALAY